MRQKGPSRESGVLFTGLQSFCNYLLKKDEII